MTTTEVIQKLREKFLSKIVAAATPVPDMVMITVAREDAVEVADFVFNDWRARFIIAAGTDYREITGEYLVDYNFSLAADHIFLTLRVRVPATDPWIYAITPRVPAANWAEREIQDLLGIRLVGHPDPRRLVLSDDWPEGLHPLRRDVPYDSWPDHNEVRKPPMAEPPQGASVVPIGPFFPVLEEPAYFRVFVEGEKVVGCDYRGFYNHRGIEKLADSQLNYNQVPFLAERICGI
jgi:Ni,Fe-hydrogenase III component G